MQIDPRHLLILAEIYDSGGFTEAAQNLATSQPGLSRMVKELELRLGDSIFSRTRKPLQLTPMGRRLVEQGRAIKVATRRAEESSLRIRSGEEGELRIGATPFILEGFMSGLIAEFQVEHRNVSIQFSHGYSEELIKQVISDQLDIALCPVDVLDPEKNLSFTPLIKGHNVIACRKGHPLRSKRILNSKDLVAYPWVAPPPLSPLHDDLKNVLLAIDAKHINIIASGGGLGSVVNYVVHSDCLTVLPHTVVFALSRQGSLSALHLPLNHPSRTVGIVSSNTNHSLPIIQKFTFYMEDRVSRLLDQIHQHETQLIGSSNV